MGPMNVILTGAVIACAACLLNAAEPANVFGDGMVLQRDVKVPIWGTATPGGEVVVEFAGQKTSTRAGADGRWKAYLAPLTASSTGRDLVISEFSHLLPTHPSPTHPSPSRQTSVLHDVLVGEVWVVSGQSNACVPMWGDNPHVRDQFGALKAGMFTRNDVRICACGHKWEVEPQDDFRSRVTWRKAAAGHAALSFYIATELNAALGVPVGIIHGAWGATGIEAWIPAEGMATQPCLAEYAKLKAVDEKLWTTNMILGKCDMAQTQPRTMWNAKFEPWHDYAVKGVFWYQGCHNARLPAHYCEKMHALFDGFKIKFRNPDLRFYFVQLPPYGSDIHVIQEEQERFAREAKNVGMAVVNDLGNNSDVHPNRKWGVALRLVALALNRDYGFKNLVADSPRLRSWKVENGRFLLTFDHVKRWSLYNPDWSVDAGFEIAGTDGRFVRAALGNLQEKTTRPYKSNGLVDGLVLEVSAPEVKDPKHLRFLHSAPWYGALMNEGGLPVGPFHVDL